MSFDESVLVFLSDSSNSASGAQYELGQVLRKSFSIASDFREVFRRGDQQSPSTSYPFHVI
jgi:hypothetical protein